MTASMDPSRSKVGRIARIARVAVLASVFVVPFAATVDDASAADFVGCSHPSVAVKAQAPLGVAGRNGAPRATRLRVATRRTTGEPSCSGSYSVVKRGVVRTVGMARLTLVLRRSTNGCDGLTGPGAGAAWSGKVTIRYLDAAGKPVAVTRRVGTFHVLDHATSGEGPGVVEISASPADAPASGAFAGTNLVMKVLYDAAFPPYDVCLTGGWNGLAAPTFMYWEEF